MVKALEDFARDLLTLTKTFAVYPEGHPAPLNVAERLSRWRLADEGGEDQVSIGFTPTRLLVGNCFYGTAGSRCEALAAYFHGRKVMRLTWSTRVTGADVMGFAALLASTRLAGAELCDALHAAGSYAVGLEPLEVAKIHGTLTLDGRREAGKDAGERSLEAWLWLQSDALQPAELARTLVADGFWELGEQDPVFAAGLLFRHRSKLGAALGLLPEAEAECLRDRLGRLPQRLSAAELAAAVLSHGRAEAPQDDGESLLLEGLDAAALVELIAAVVAETGAATARVAGLFRSVAPRRDVAELLGLVDARLSLGGGGAYAEDVWQTVRSLLLDLDEEGFFGDQYADELEALAAAPDLEPAGPELPRPARIFAEDPEPHLDRICFDLACSGDAQALLRLRRRLIARLPQLEAGEILDLVAAADAGVPELLAGQEELLREIFAKLAGSVRTLDAAGRASCVCFARTHEAAVLDPAITALIRERRIAGRRFLVEVLAALSPATTAAMIERACTAPWYYLRNVATVLGRRADRGSAPVLCALLDHPHGKVREEALRSLSLLGGAARRAVEGFATDGARAVEERQLARRLLARRGTTGEQRPAEQVPA